MNETMRGRNDLLKMALGAKQVRHLRNKERNGGRIRT